MNNEFAMNLFIFFQSIGLLVVLFDWDMIEAKMEEDKANLPKWKYKRVWIGRTFMLFLPSLSAISIAYNPL